MLIIYIVTLWWEGGVIDHYGQLFYHRQCKFGLCCVIVKLDVHIIGRYSQKN